MQLLGLILVGACLSGSSIAATSNSQQKLSSFRSTNETTRPFVPKFGFYKNKILIKTCYGVHLRRKKLQPGGQHWVMPAECFDRTKYDMIWIYGYEKGVAKTTLKSIPYRTHPQYNATTKAHNIAVVSFNSHQDHIKGYSYIELPSEPQDFELSTLELFKHNKSSPSDTGNVKGYSCIELPSESEDFNISSFELNALNKDRTNAGGLENQTSLYTVNTKPINPFWCRLLYPSSPIKENHICASGWFGKGLSEDELGTPVITEYCKTFRLVGLATIVRPWTHYVSFPIEILRIEPYLDWINSILDEELTLSSI